MRKKHAARRDIEISTQVRGNRMSQSGNAVHRRKSLGVEQHQLAPMSQNHLETRHAIERAGKDKANKLDACIIVPTKTVGREGRIDLRIEARIISLTYGHCRCARVKQYRRAQGLRTLENRRERRIVKVARP